MDKSEVAMQITAAMVNRLNLGSGSMEYCAQSLPGLTQAIANAYKTIHNAVMESDQEHAGRNRK